MRTARGRVVLAALVGLLVAGSSIASSHAQRTGSGGWGPKGTYHRLYDVATVETIGGEVVSVEAFTPENGMSTGVHLMLRTEGETVSVHLGPQWFLDNQDAEIAAGETIEVTGSRVTFASEPAIIAAQVRRGDDLLKLRDERGFPVWSGWRRRGPTSGP